MEKTLNYITGLYDGGKGFYYSRNRKQKNLYSTCFGLLALSLTGSLNLIEKPGINEIIKYIKSKQSESGFFSDENILTNSLNHKQTYIDSQLTDFSLLALSCVEENPMHRLCYIMEFKDEHFLRYWLNSLNWRNPWLESNKVMFVLNALFEDSRYDKNSLKYIEILLDWLYYNQDPKTGYWSLGKRSSLLKQMAGAYHFLFYYTFFRKKLRFWDRIVDSTLLLQNNDGLFGYGLGGGSCEDLDAIDLLCRTTFYTNYRREEIYGALAKSHSAILNNQNPDGGFCWAKINRERVLSHLVYKFRFFPEYISDFGGGLKKTLKQIRGCDRWAYSGVKEMQINIDESDIWSTWVRLLSLALIESTLPEGIIQPVGIKWTFLKRPGIGFYK
jgi:hypothetical protein